MLVPLLLGLVHAALDAATVSATMRACQVGPLPVGGATALILGYDLLAFAGQVPLGWLTDRFGSPKRAMLTGVALTLVSLLAPGFGAVSMVVAAGLGNALFHLGAGAAVLRLGLERATPVGVFVAPGALGLGFGMMYGPRSGPLWPIAVVIVFLFGLFLWIERSLAAAKASAPRPVAEKPRSYSVLLVMLLLLFSILVRSLVGSFAARGYERSDLLLFGLPIAACLGKGLGGVVADRFGWLETTVIALLVSLPLIALAPPTTFLLLGLLLFQMTMPVTLTAAARVLPDRLATAFGLTCFALVLGVLPKAVPSLAFLGQRSVLALFILLAAGSLYWALRRLGFGSASLRVAPTRTADRIES